MSNELLLGRYIERDFAGHGKFIGRVVDFHRQTGYRVLYDDGDEEDLPHRLVVKHLKVLTGKHARPDPPLPPPPKNLNPPSTSLSELVRNAQKAARRKRKHTFLKRSGVLQAEEDAKRRKAAEAAARREAEREAAIKPAPMRPPDWAVGMNRNGRSVRCPEEAIRLAASHAERLRRQQSDKDCSLYRLEIEAVTPTSVQLSWCYPLGSPGDNGAWVGLFPAECVEWLSEYGEVSSGSAKLQWRGITKNSRTGQVSFAKLPGSMRDGEYCFTLQRDYGVQCAAVSQIITVLDGLVVSVACGTNLYSAEAKVDRKQRQLSASMGLQQLSRKADADCELLDEQQCFPLTAVDIALPRDYLEQLPLLKEIYRVVDKKSYLDWGLTSDYESTDKAKECGGEHRLRARDAAPAVGEAPPPLRGVQHTQYSELELPTLAARAARLEQRFGLGGGTKGSEGYGEATMGSVHKIGVALAHLRQLVLQELKEDGWGMLWDLGPWSSFLDIGSGYGKVVLHLSAFVRLRAAVGFECVQSRHQIAMRSKELLEALPEARREEGQPQGYAAKENRKQAEQEDKENGELIAPELQEKGKRIKAELREKSEQVKVELKEQSEQIKVELKEKGEQIKVEIIEPELKPQAAADGPSVAFRQRGAFDAVDLRYGDATKETRLCYTHIYIFDWVFSEHTLREIAALLQASPFYVLLSFRPCSEWWSYGLTKVQPVAKIPGFRTSGKESMTCLVYVNLEKVPSTPA